MKLLAMPPTSTLPDQLVDAEQKWNSLLVDWRAQPTGTGAGAQAGIDWSERVWSIALGAGAFELTADDRSRGLALAAHPVFVCGVHRSGTTLLRDLLDDHPAISVLPSEGTFYTGSHRRVASLPAAVASAPFAKEWLRRLANPTHQAPFWVLGRSGPSDSPYVAFARAYLTWWPEVRDRFSRTSSSWPLAVVALAYAYCRARLRIPPELRYWAEKTPTNERFRRRLARDFPDARFIQVLRDPFATYASRRAMDVATFGDFRDERAALRDLARTYRVALAERANARYRVVRYEELLQSRPATMRALADFLSIDAHPNLMTPTVAGLSTTSNSSFSAAGVAAVELSASERHRVADAAGISARRVGYAVPESPSLRARLLRFLGR